jgi:glycogen synthase
VVVHEGAQKISVVANHHGPPAIQHLDCLNAGLSRRPVHLHDILIVMRIVLIGPYPPPYGGMAVQIQEWHRHLIERYECECVVLNIGESRRERFDGCVQVFSYLDFVRKLYALGRQGYLFHLVTTGHSFKSWLSSLVCALAGMTNGFRSLLVFGSGDAPIYLRSANIFVVTVVRLIIGLAGHVICRNEEMRATLIGVGANPNKVTILPGFLGVHSRSDMPLPQSVQQFIDAHRPILGATVYVPKTGVLYPEYGLELITAAIQELRKVHPNIGVVLMGPGSEMQAQIKDADQLSEHLCFTGPLSHDLVLNTMRNLTVFVRPTYTDGDSISVREALALKIPVVASDAAYRPQRVLCFAKGNAHDFVEKLSRVLGDRSAFTEDATMPDGSDNATRLFNIYTELNRSAGFSGNVRAVATKGASHE